MQDRNERRKVIKLLDTLVDSAISDFIGELASSWALSKKPKDLHHSWWNSCSHPYTLHLRMGPMAWTFKHHGW